VSRTKHSYEKGTPLAWRRWRRRNALIKPSNSDRRGEYRLDVIDGWREYNDTAFYLGEPLDYIASDVRHLNDARMDQRGGYQSKDRKFSKTMRINTRGSNLGSRLVDILCDCCAIEGFGFTSNKPHTCNKKDNT